MSIIALPLTRPSKIQHKTGGQVHCPAVEPLKQGGTVHEQPGWSPPQRAQREGFSTAAEAFALWDCCW